MSAVWAGRADFEGGEKMFKFPAYRALKQELGAYDACVEVVELALRDFREMAAKNSKGLDAYIAEAAGRHGLYVSSVAPELLNESTANLYIVLVHQALDSFLSKLRREVPERCKWSRQADGSSSTSAPLNAAVKQAGIVSQTSGDDLVFRICDYYRLLRNSFAHGESASSLELPLTLRDELSRDARFSKLAAPNQPGHQTFDDFVLYTRCVKLIAKELCESFRLSDHELLLWLSHFEDTRPESNVRGEAGRHAQRRTNRQQQVDTDSEASLPGPKPLMVEVAKACRLSNNLPRLRMFKVAMLQKYFSLSSDEAASLLVDG